MCPNCSDPNTTVLSTHPSGAAHVRRRECGACGHRWSTIETSRSAVPESVEMINESLRRLLERQLQVEARLVAILEAYQPPKKETANQ